MKSEVFAILTSWNLLKVHGEFFVSGTHYTYLQYASEHYEKIYLISSIRNADEEGNQKSINEFKNIEVVELPTVSRYIGAIRNFKHYCRAIKYVKDKVDFIYCRVPDPFCYLPRLKYSMPSVMHFVGDTIDATKHNEKWNWFRKAVMITGYLPEYALTLLASKKSTTYTNGPHIHEKLKKYGIKSTVVISSTVSDSELVNPEAFRNTIPPKMIYVGFLRFAKGMNLLKDLWILLKNTYPDFQFDVVGGGEMETDIKTFIGEHNLESNVILHGRIDDRNRLRSLLRDSDLFIFPSLSEGSPRVVIEAMAEGVPVLSTPVGSLPGTFIDGDTIRYFDFNNAELAYSIIDEYCHNTQPFQDMRNRAFSVVRDKYTKEKFLAKIYSI